MARPSRHRSAYCPHNLHENRPSAFQSSRLIFATYYNAGVRAYDIFNQFQSREVGFYVPPNPARMMDPSPGYIAAHGTPQKPNDLLGHEALMQGTEAWRLVDHGKTIVLRPRGRFKADNGAALLAAALAGLGVAALPDFLIEAHVASGALKPVLANYPPPKAGMFVVRPPGDFPPRKVRVLTEILFEYFGTAIRLSASELTS